VSLNPSLDERHVGASKAVKMTPDMIYLITLKLDKKWNPEQISGWLLAVRKELLSHETIYLHI